MMATVLRRPRPILAIYPNALSVVASRSIRSTMETAGGPQP